MAHARIRTSYDLGPYGSIIVATSDGDPAAGAEIAVTVPGRAVWRVHSISMELAADATATSRRVSLQLTDGNTEIWRCETNEETAASETRGFLFMGGWGHENNAPTRQAQTGVPFPLVLLPGWQLNTITGNLQAGDNYAAPVLYVEEIPQRGVAVGQDALRSALRQLIGEEGSGG